MSGLCLAMSESLRMVHDVGCVHTMLRGGERQFKMGLPATYVAGDVLEGLQAGGQRLAQFGHDSGRFT